MVQVCQVYRRAGVFFVLLHLLKQNCSCSINFQKRSLWRVASDPLRKAERISLKMKRMFFPLKDKSHLTSSYLPHIVQPQFKKIKIGYFCYHLFNKETLRMPYKKYLLVVNRTAFPYFVHKIMKNNPRTVAGRFEKLGWGHKIRSLFIIRTCTH